MDKERVPQAQLRRVFGIFSILARSRAPVSIDKLIEKLGEYGLEPGDSGLTPRTIQRDIKFIRDEMGYSIKSFPNEGYVLANRGSSGDDLLPLYFEPKEIQALIMGRELFEPFEGTHLADAIESMYEKVAKVFTGKDAQGPLEELENVFHIRQVRRRQYKPQKKIIETLTSAILKHKVVDVTFGGVKVFNFKLRPHKFVIYENSLYLIAANENPKYPGHRLYLVPRIKSVEMTSVSFRPSATDVIDEKIEDSWGILLEGPVKDIRITFDKGLEGYLQERVWHKSQKFVSTAKGVEMHLHIILNAEIVNWVLGFGNKVLGLQPEELADMVDAAKK